VRERAYLFAAILLIAGLAPAARGEDTCTPWPGEIQPLPRVDDADPLHARWARMRADRLAQQALALEGPNRVEANRLWQRVLCLDPASASARAGVERTRPRVVLQLPAPARPKAPAASRPAASPRRPAPPGPVTAAKAPEPERQPALREEVARLDASLARVEEQLRTARFDEALSDLSALRGRIGEVDDALPIGEQRVRLEVLSATAHVAYGDEGAARASLRRALEVDPALDLDAARTPPKLRRALDAARREAQP
jgi:hypothetical protein